MNTICLVTFLLQTVAMHGVMIGNLNPSTHVAAAESNVPYIDQEIFADKKSIFIS